MVRPAVILLAVVALASTGCMSRRDTTLTEAQARSSRPQSSLKREIVGYQQIWAQGHGKVGYLITYDVSQGPDKPVTLFFVEDLENVEKGWVTPDGQGMKFHTPETAVASAHRAAFLEVPLPQDDLENQVRRIFDLDPTTPLSFYAGR